MSIANIIDETAIRLTQLQIKTINELKERATQNKKYAPNESYLQGFMKACNLIIEIIDNPTTDEGEGN